MYSPETSRHCVIIADYCRYIESEHKELEPVDRQMRIFVGLTEVAGVYSRIVESLRLDGYPVSFSQLSQHPFYYPAENELSDYRYERFLKFPIDAKNQKIRVLLRIFFRLHLMVWAIRKFDVFVFVAGGSFLPKNIDLYLLRLFRKRIVSHIGHGSEARPAFMDGAHWSIAIQKDCPIRSIYKTTHRQQRHMRRIERLSTELIASPLTSQFLSRRAISSGVLGVPCPKNSRTPVKESADIRTKSIKIVHAPSNRRAKGSDQIAKMISVESTKHPNIEYVELFNRSNAEVIRELEDADLVIDQLYSDTFLAGLGVEAASLGVPALVGNYGIGILKNLYDSSLIPPAFVVHPTHIESKLSELLENVNVLQEVGKCAKEFIQTRQSPKVVADRFIDIANGSFPDDWYFSPIEVSYIHGLGLAEDELVKICKDGLDTYGDKFFRLHNRLDLREEIYRLIEANGV